MNKVPGKIKISYVLVEIIERPLNIPKRPSIENIGILYNYGHLKRGEIFANNFLKVDWIWLEQFFQYF